MKNNLIFNNGKNKPTAENTLKVTALLCLREALLREQYETCADLIRRAKRYGAGQNEVSLALFEHTRGLKAGPQNEANQIPGGRRRF